jgi:hypothetical protein
MIKTVRILTIIILVIASGCIAIPSDRPADQERPVKFIAENKANTTYTFEVFVVQRPANLSIVADDGRKATDDIDEGFSITNTGNNSTYARIEPPDSARLHGRFVVKPGESYRSSIKDPPRNVAIVVVVYRDENEIIGFVTGNCDDLALDLFRVTSHSSDSERWSASRTRAGSEVQSYTVDTRQGHRPWLSRIPAIRDR